RLRHCRLFLLPHMAYCDRARQPRREGEEFQGTLRQACNDPGDGLSLDSRRKRRLQQYLWESGTHLRIPVYCRRTIRFNEGSLPGADERRGDRTYILGTRVDQQRYERPLGIGIGVGKLYLLRL